MNFHIRHLTRYTFSRRVFLEPHVLRFQPRSDGGQVLRNFRLHVSPEPAGLTHALDAEGNVVAHAWFDPMCDELEVVAECHVDTLRTNPFDYLLPVEGTLPLRYEPILSALLAPACAPKRGAADDAVDALVQDVLTESGPHLLSYLTALNRTIYERVAITRRDHGGPWQPEMTLEQGEASCRDVAVVFIEACRRLGIAARFVSGYQEGDPDQDVRDLHAWAEVYLPGGGWRGFDPTHALAVADGHVAVAASVDPAHAAAITGTFRGTGVTSTIEHHIAIRRETTEQMQQ